MFRKDFRSVVSVFVETSKTIFFIGIIYDIILRFGGVWMALMKRYCEKYIRREDLMRGFSGLVEEEKVTYFI
jgi:hypothetical protein